MHKRSSYVTRFILLMILCTVGTAILFFGLSSYFFNEYNDSARRSALKQELSEASQLLSQYQNGEITLEELKEAVNPLINPDDVFYMLVSDNNEVLAYTDNSTVYIADDMVNQMIDSLQESNTVTVKDMLPGAMAMMMGEKVPSGYVFTGLPMWLVSGGNNPSTFYNRLLAAMGLGLVLIMMIGIISFRRAGKPAQMITEMSARMIRGEQVILPENLPGHEMQEIAKAMNHMSRSVSSAFQELRYERDITTLTLEGLNEGVLAVNMQGEILHENSAASRLLGEGDSPVREAVLTALKDERQEMQWDGKIQKDGAILYYAISRLPQHNGEFQGRVALIRDITEQERLERTRHDYVANISHELRTPLASIRGLGEGLRDEMVTEEKDRQRYYSIIVDEATRLSRLVNDLLELSSLQSNPTAFETETIDPNELIYELHDLNGNLFKEKGVSFFHQLPQEPLPDILFNEDRLSQVLTIFLDNARKYTPKGGQVWIGAEKADEGVRFFVRDTGIGMDEETKRLAFDRFHQAEKGRSDKGSGLGLSIAQEILQKMQVEIRVESEKNQGSEFSFIIPRAANSCISLTE